MSDYRLSPLQNNELELLLAGGFESPDYALPTQGALLATLRVPGPFDDTTVTLLDREATPVAEVQVTATQFENGGTWVAGQVTQLRPLAPGDYSQLRPARRPEQRDARAMLALGDVADLPTDPSEPVIVVDHADSTRLTRSVSRAERAAHPVHVMPEPAAEHLRESERHDLLERIAVRLFAETVDTRVSVTAKGDGVVILFTGLSGSGKSTVARALAQRLRADDGRRVSLLDGDEIRAMLSKGLGFTREDRELNVRRIGWVAALVAEHGGLAICAPIAPYASMRREMRVNAEKAGRFLLIHVATPLEVCEARDRKGLYAKARAGQLQGFTGVSDPYDVPTDADVTIDTSIHSTDDAVDMVVAALRPPSHDDYII